MIELRDVTLQVEGRPLLCDINARIGAGELVAVLGPNGVGKTTLLRAMAGIHPIAGGAISVDGDPIARLASIERARRIALVATDEILLEALRVNDVVSIGRFPHHRWWQWRELPSDESAIGEALASVKIEDFSQRFFSTLSAGERQRVWIALGLAQETPVLLLDEPTSHLDVRVAHEILALLRTLANAGKTVVCALHDPNEAAAYADRVLLLGDGRLVAFGTPDALLDGPLLERVYGITMERVRLSDGRLRVFAREALNAPGARPTPRPNA